MLFLPLVLWLMIYSLVHHLYRWLLLRQDPSRPGTLLRVAPPLGSPLQNNFPKAKLWQFQWQQPHNIACSLRTEIMSYLFLWPDALQVTSHNIKTCRSSNWTKLSPVNLKDRFSRLLNSTRWHYFIFSRDPITALETTEYLYPMHVYVCVWNSFHATHLY